MKNTEVILVVPGTTKIVETSLPQPKEDEVLLQVEYVGICGSDVHSFAHGPFIPPSDPNQKIGLGHECAGRVVAVGSDVTEFHVGDRVCIEPGVLCGHCRYCREGRYNICPQVDFMATQPHYRGALTNYLCHPAEYTYHLPENMSTLEGALVEPAAVGMHAAMLAGVRPGMKIAILGAGCIGLMTLQACRLMGATEILVSDVLPKRLEMAQSLGATQTIRGNQEDAVSACRSFFGGNGPNLIFETAGSPVTLQQAVNMVDRGGKILVVGTHSQEVAINFLSINREVSIQTVFRYTNCFPATIQAIASGKFDVKSMVTHQYSYTQSQQAFEESVSQKQNIIKGVIQVAEPFIEGRNSNARRYSLLGE